MPTYQYACTACSEQSEAVQAFSDAPLTECSACGGRLRKVFSAVGVVFKGSGFYKNDSRPAAKGDSAPGKGDSAPAKADTGGKSDAGSKSDSSSAAPAKADGAASKPTTTPAAKTA